MTQTRKPGRLMCWPASPSIRPPDLTIFSLGIGVLAKHAPSRRPDLGCHHTCLHHHIRRRNARRGRGLARELSIDMFAEHGCLYVYRGKDDEDDAVTVFTDYGVECLK